MTLALALPVVVYSSMVQDWFGDSAPSLPGDGLVAPVLGTMVYLYGGWPFLSGAARELRSRRPGMMLLIAMAITVAFGASWATSLDVFRLDFWWELAALVLVMLLGHWMEMRALGQARGALSALAELLPDEAERVRGEDVEIVAVSDLAEGDVVLVRPGGRVPADGELLSDRAELDESMVTEESRPVACAPRRALLSQQRNLCGLDGGVSRGELAGLQLPDGVSRAVAAIPGGLAAVVTITLALGMRMALIAAVGRSGRRPAVLPLGL